MKQLKVESVILIPSIEVQEAVRVEMKEVPAFGSITVKVIFHAGQCRILVVKRKTMK